MQSSYTRLFSDESGESRFEFVTIEQQATDYAPPAPALNVSEPGEATKWMLVTGEAGWDGNWHPSPVRQFMICMSGTFEVEASSGERKIFKPGDVLLLDDLTGKGHYTRIPEDSDATVFTVHL